MAVKIKGLDKALKDLDKKSDDVVKAVVEVITEAVDGIALDGGNAAKQAVINFRGQFPPDSFRGKDLNFPQRLNRVVENGGLNQRYGLEVADTEFEIEAWLEFGTGLSAQEILSRADYTNDVRDVARGFYRNGKGTIKGSPYIFPAFFKNTANLVEEIKKEIEKATK